jgi:hypothetical protein
MTAPQSVWDPTETNVQQILTFGRGICSGYFPHITPGHYMEIWEYESYIYIIEQNEDGTFTVHPIGTSWSSDRACRYRPAMPLS